MGAKYTARRLPGADPELEDTSRVHADGCPSDGILKLVVDRDRAPHLFEVAGRVKWN